MTDQPPRASIAPSPTPEEAAAIVVALHHHRLRAQPPPHPSLSAWQRAARQEALRRDWSAPRPGGWRAGLTRR